MAIITKHVSLVPIDGLDYEAHIDKHFGPSITIESMDTLGISFSSYDDSDSRTIICLQADSTKQDALNAAAKSLSAWSVEELTEVSDPNTITGLVTVAGILQPARTMTDPESISQDYSAPLVDTVTGKLKRNITPTP